MGNKGPKHPQHTGKLFHPDPPGFAVLTGLPCKLQAVHESSNYRRQAGPADVVRDDDDDDSDDDNDENDDEAGPADVVHRHVYARIE